MCTGELDDVVTAGSLCSLRHAAMLDAYRRRDWQGALGILEEPELSGENELAGLYELFRERIAEMQIEPPPPDWDGVFVATEK